MLKKKLKKIKGKVLLLLAVLSMTAGYAVTSNAQNQEIAAIAEIIQQSVAPGSTGANPAAGSVKVGTMSRDAVKDFYTQRAYAPFWISGRGDLDRAEDALRLFRESWTHGFNPETYHAAQIDELMKSEDPKDLAKLELLLTDGAMRYGHDLTGMRIDPRTIHQKAEYWREPLSGGEVLEKISAGGSPVAALRDLAPHTALYKALQKELVRLSNEQEDYERVLPMGFGGNSYFTPGSRHKDVAALRVRLGISHDSSAGSENYYDDNTAAAVMTFQREHGLEPDGIIGPQTLAELNRSSRDRMEQIIANLERLRWLEQERPDRYLLVNIPQQLLWAVENGKVVDEIKVVVGMPVRKTKDFKATVTGVRFNPTWTVPLNLKMHDFLPKLQQDPGYLAQKGIQVIKGSGSERQTLNPEAVDWSSVGWKEMNKMRFVQSPGDHNALGQVRILMANDYDIYMHDTNHPEFFEKDQRTYSSGCIRLSEPKKVANFVLEHNEGWSQAKMDELIARGKTVEVEADKPFPVYIIYQTAWLDGSGDLVFGADIYKRDKELIDVLAKADAYVLPMDGDSRYAAADGGGLYHN